LASRVENDHFFDRERNFLKEKEEMAHKTLVRSSTIAAISVAIPTVVANAGFPAVYNDQGTFDAAVTATQTQVWSDDMEAYAPAYGYQMLAAPISGLGDGSVSMGSSDGTLFAFAGNYYFPNMTSTTVGVLEGRTASFSFANGVNGFGMELMGTSSFTASPFANILYTIRDMNGVAMVSGDIAVDGTGVGYMGVQSNSALIGSVEFSGADQFFFGAAVYADNIRGFVVPAPSTAALIGLSGLVATRRRR
jgi:hypothetical protein